MISIKEVLIQGLRNIYYNLKLVLLLWGTNAISAFILTVPLYYVLVEDLKRSILSDVIAVKFDYLWYMQFHNNYKTTVGEIPLVIYSVVGVYALIQTFYLGGLIAVFNNPAKNHMVDFFFGGVKYWLRFTKILLISLVLFAAAIFINDMLGESISIIFKDTEYELSEFILRSIRYVLFIFFIGVITIISDYSKVALAVKDRENVWRCIYYAIIFIKKNFSKVFIVFLIVSIIGALGSILYNFLGREIPRTPFYFLVLSFILQQMLIIFRLVVRMLFCATEVVLYNDLSADFVKPIEN
ncbi:MAG: hypothetical protein V1720_22620 [bacterium]